MQRQLIAEQWDQFVREVIPKDAPAHQKQEMRRAFYAGGVAIFFLMLNGVSDADESTPDDLAMMRGLDKELQDFAESVKAGRS